MYDRNIEQIGLFILSLEIIELPNRGKSSILKLVIFKLLQECQTSWALSSGRHYRNL